MSNRIRPVKLLPVWIAVSAVVILAGIILTALLGFNFSADKPKSKTFEVQYDVLIQITESEEALQDVCEDAFEKAGIEFVGSAVTEEVDPSTLYETVNKKLVYTFAGSVSDDSLAQAAESVRTAVEEMKTSDTKLENSEVYVSYHSLNNQVFYEAVWRGAVAIAVGAIVALIYVGIRFGVGSALTGLCLCVHDALFTLAVFAIARIPTYYFAPLVFAAMAVVLSVILWTVQCFKMRENFKDPSYAALSAEEAVAESGKTAWKIIVGIAVSLAVVFIVCGALATSASRLFLLLGVVPVAVAVYSSLLLGPAIHVPVKAAFDKLKAKRSRYVGKKKAAKETVSEN